MWAVMESGCHLVKQFDTAPKQNLTESYCSFRVHQVLKKNILYKI